MYVRDRTPSWSDVYAQTLGGVSARSCGLLVGVVTHQVGRGRFRARHRARNASSGPRAVRPRAGPPTACSPRCFPIWRIPSCICGRRGTLSRLVLAGPLSIAAFSAMPVGAVCGPSERAARPVVGRCPVAARAWLAGRSRSRSAGGRHARRWPPGGRRAGLLEWMVGRRHSPAANEPVGRMARGVAADRPGRTARRDSCCATGRLSTSA